MGSSGSRARNHERRSRRSYLGGEHDTRLQPPISTRRTVVNNCYRPDVAPMHCGVLNAAVTALVLHMWRGAHLPLSVWSTNIRFEPPATILPLQAFQVVTSRRHFGYSSTICAVDSHSVFARRRAIRQPSGWTPVVQSVRQIPAIGSPCRSVSAISRFARPGGGLFSRRQARARAAVASTKRAGPSRMRRCAQSISSHTLMSCPVPERG